MSFIDCGLSCGSNLIADPDPHSTDFVGFGSAFRVTVPVPIRILVQVFELHLNMKRCCERIQTFNGHK